MASTTPESKVKTKIKATLKNYGAYYAMPIGSGFGVSGTPDFLCCVNGHFLAIEAKANGGKTTALQEKSLRSIREAGGIAIVIDENNMKFLVECIEALNKDGQP